MLNTSIIAMNAQHCSTRPRHVGRHRARRGVVTLLLLAALALLVALVGLTVNWARLSAAHTQTQAASEAAALAAAAELLDEHHLWGASDLSDDMLHARHVAAYFAHQYDVEGHEVRLGANLQNLPDGDIVMGYVPDPDDFRSGFHAWDGQGPVNSVMVRCGRTRWTGDPISVAFGKMLGVPHADVATVAIASLEQGVIGFRPRMRVRAPLLPVATDLRHWSTQLGVEATEENDQWSVDARTGVVVNQPDGIAEMTFHYTSLTCDGDMPWCSFDIIRLSNSASGWSEQRLLEQAMEGLSQADLELFGGELVLQSEGTLVPVEINFSPLKMASLLSAVTGVNRVWPLATWGSDGSCRIVGFGAGRVVHTEVSECYATIVVQPSVLITGTGICHRSVPRNPCIGKVRLHYCSHPRNPGPPRTPDEPPCEEDDRPRRPKIGDDCPCDGDPGEAPADDYITPANPCPCAQ